MGTSGHRDIFRRKNMLTKDKQKNRGVTRAEIIETIKKLARRLGRVPTEAQVQTLTRLKRKDLRKHFTNFSGALDACGMENPHRGVTVSTAKLFEDWARVARMLRKLPSTKAYRKLGRHSMEAVMRLAGHWPGVPRAMADYAQRNGLRKKWKDVMALIGEQMENDWPTNAVKRPIPAKRRPQLKKDRPIYGPPITRRAMLHLPTNESGVMFLFASMALELGFMATIVRTGFPDCEALREVSPNRLQRERIEFEYLAKNFLKHRHRLDGCDIIVCWINNWPDCPLEVIELSKIIGRSGDRG
ncbi:MAG TPA: hypothetical protein VFR84_13935 [Candidatus Angelobacter sp.]|nr:hypothetical protein [Candidatus Angelobacter sp.]